MIRFSWLFCCNRRVFSCSRVKMYSAVCCRMAAFRGKMNRIKFKKVDHKSKKRLILTHRWGTFRGPPCWASPHHCVGWAFSVIGTQHWCSAYADAHCCWRSLCEFASLGPGLFLESKECWPDWRAKHKRTQSVRCAKMIQGVENLIKKTALWAAMSSRINNTF